MKKLTLLIAVIFSLHLVAEPQHGVIYVVPNGTGTGASWTDALGSIQDAIVLAKSDDMKRKDVWVKAGTYTVTTCISLADSVNVYGGFAGTETDVAQRAKVTGGRAWDFVNPTILDGNNAQRLIQVSSGTFDKETIFDGFTLMNGNGVGSATSNSGGGAMIRPNTILQNCIVKNNNAIGSGGGVMLNGGGTVRHCLIMNNKQTTAANGGGGVFCNTSSTGYTGYIENCVVTGNSSTVRGAGVGIQGTTGYVYVTNCEIFNNTSYDVSNSALKPGGGLYNNNLPYNRVMNCLIYNNTGLSAVYYNGGNFYNNTIVKNVGGMYITGAVTCVNNIIWGCATDATGTTATSLTGAVNTGTTVQNNATYNPISTTNSWTTSDNFQFSSNVSNGDVLSPAEGTVGSGPKFNHVSRFIGAATTDEEKLQLDSVDWSISMASPCLDEGKNVAVVTSDFTGLMRPQGYPAAEALTDIGAYELPYYIVVAGEPATANGAIYSSLGQLLPENQTYGFAKGSKLELFFQPNQGYKINRAYYTASLDGGLTFTGEQVEFTNQIDEIGFWSANVEQAMKISVDWQPLTSVKKIDMSVIQCFATENGIQINGTTVGEKINVYHVSGMHVKGIYANETQTYIAVPKGVYIVHMSQGVQKVLVK